MENRIFFGDMNNFYSKDMKFIGGRGLKKDTNKSVVNIWNVETNELVMEKNISGYGYLIDMSVDYKFVLIADNIGEPQKTYFLYNLNLGRIVKDDFIDKNSDEISKQASVVRFSGDLKYAAIAIEGKLHVYDISSLTAHANEGFTLTK